MTVSGKPERIALDVHAHLAPILPDELASIDGVTWQDDKKILVVDGHAVGMKQLFDPPALLAWMDRNAVERAWISIPPPLYRTQLVGDEAQAWMIYANNGLSGIADRYPDRLAPLPHLPLQAPDVALQTVRDWAERGHRRFSAPSGGYGELVLSDKTYEPIWRALNDAGAFVFFHPGECADGRLTAFYLSNLLGNPYETAVAIGHLAFGGVLERFDEIRFCFAHGGGVLPMLAGRFERGFETARPGIDTKLFSPKRAFKNVCVDCITHDIGSLRLAEETFGAENVLFGSDWPFPMGCVEPHAQLVSLDPARRQRIFCDNPARLTEEK
jgi:aminocarboxymuconate-semialdehyde decarboxylase